MRADLVAAEVENLLFPSGDNQHSVLGPITDIPGIEMSVAESGFNLAVCVEITADADRRPDKHRALVAGRQERTRFVNDAHRDIRRDMADSSCGAERMRRRR